MRRMWAAGAAVVMSLAIGGVTAVAQGTTEPAVAVSSTHVCDMDAVTISADGFSIPCTNAASNPRVSGEATLTGGDAGDVSVPGSAAGLAWGDYRLTGPDGGWSGHWYNVWFDEEVGGLQTFLVLSGEGAYEGLTYVSTARSLDGSPNFDGFGVSYAGPPPPAFGPLPPAPSAAAPSPGASTPPSPATLATIGLPADDGARIVAVEGIDARTRDLTIESPSVGTVKVRLLLPEAFEAQPAARWPVLYLLQGCCDTYDSWARETDIAELTAPTDLLVVMPAATTGDDAGFGWYTDWYNGGQGGQPAWETFHLTELRQLLERNWQAGDDRVIAGLSMGGHGAMTYAARHPGMFKAAASFSGVLHTLDPTLDADSRVWGSKTQQADIWAAHDPVSLAPALEGLPLYVSYGNGELGPLDDEENQEMADLEAWLSGLNEAFVARLEELRIPATVDAYGPGTHTWPYWERGLHAAMPMLLEALGR